MVWFVIYTKAGEEDKAEVNLKYQSFETYLPRLRKEVITINNIKEVIVPLFPRYLFIKIHHDSIQKNIGLVRSTYGVSSLLKIDESKFAFCWIVDYPMFEVDELTKKIQFSHNPFSMPQGDIKNINFEKPLEIKQETIDSIRLIEINHFQQLDPVFKKGEKVSIRDGSYKNIEAIFLTDNNEKRATLLFDLIGKPTKITVEKNKIKKINY